MYASETSLMPVNGIFQLPLISLENPGANKNTKTPNSNQRVRVYEYKEKTSVHKLCARSRPILQTLWIVNVRKTIEFVCKFVWKRFSLYAFGIEKKEEKKQ